jgi:uncharacterized protein
VTQPELTLEAPSEEAARQAGASELRVSPNQVEVSEIRRGLWRVQVKGEPISVVLEADGMRATVKHLAPRPENVPAPSRAEIEAALAGLGVVAGLLDDEIEQLVHAVTDLGEERRDVIVAEGRAPVDGQDARLVNQRPGGAIVRTGDPLFELQAATTGAAGESVTGTKLPPRAGAPLELSLGPGIKQKGARYLSAVTGYLELEGDPRVAPLISVAEDNCRAWVDLRAADGEGPPLERADIDRALREAGVVHGIRTESIDRAWGLFEAHGSLPRPVCVAEATEPVPPGGGQLEWITQPTSEVSADEDRRIDFRELGAVVNVLADQEIARARPLSEGRPGRRVDGSPWPASELREVQLKSGGNVKSTRESDGSLLFSAAIDGMLVTDTEQFAVVDLLEVKGDVDYTTGNLDACGSVRVEGSVREGFRVNAGSDVWIGGMVEEAIVECGGRLTLQGGVLGGPEGHLSATVGMNLHHTQNTHLRSEGDIILGDSDTASDIQCHGRLEAREGHGRLQGGQYAATGGLRAKELGSKLGAPTRVAVGPHATLLRELAVLKLALAEASRKGTKLRRESGGTRALQMTVHLSPASAAAARRVVKSRREAIGTEAALNERQQRLEATLESQGPAKVEVEGTVHAGVELRIGKARLLITKPLDHVRFELDPESNEITTQSL